jgi:flavin-dependent dehydrogenase
MDDYDVIVIGTGTAAQVVSSRVRRAGRSVAMIDHLPFGGTCALAAAIPRKCWSVGPKRPIGRAGCTDAASLANSASIGKN